MKSEQINKNAINHHHKLDTLTDPKLKSREKHRQLVETFGSKFAVKNMNKQQRLRKTKDATIASMDRMDTAQLMDDDKITKNATDKTEEYQTKNIEKQRGKKRKNESMDNRNYLSMEHKNKYVNIFQHKFSKSPYCLFEFAYHSPASKPSKVYVLEEIIPNHIWQSMDADAVWQAWDEWSNGGNYDGLQPSEFVRRCIGFRARVKEKKQLQKYEAWKRNLVLYELSVRFIKSMHTLPYGVDAVFWQNLKRAYLEQCALENSGMDRRNKKVKYSLTRRAKMRIVGIVLLLALNCGFWKISLEAIGDIAKDLLIPKRVLLQIYRWFGCGENGKVVEMRIKIVHRKPKTAIDGQWWNV